MNHIYRSIWSEALGTWIAVSENAKSQGKQSRSRKLLATGLLICSSPVFALPTGNQLVAGQASVSTPDAATMQIDQTSQRAAINWQGFSIGQQETVNIQQPNANAALLNRVVGQDASQIQGKLNANGQVYLTNPNGVIFSKTAQVDVGGLVATTHEISNADFMNNKNHFTQQSATGKVENHGSINAKDGGVVALISTDVTNTGTINTPKGTTALAAGKTVDLDFQGDGLVAVKVSEAALNAQITNKGAITADGGRVVMTTKAANALVDTVINQEGIVKAQGLAQRNGEIILEGGLVSQTGTLDASGQKGGNVTINARAILDAGKTNADGTAGKGGNINMTASDAIIQTAAADTHANGTTQGGTIQLDSQNSTFSSGKLSATGETGGTINILSNNRIALAAADINASGNTQGGTVRVGGDFHGTNPNIKNAKTTYVNGTSKIKADGGKGKVVVWSDEKTDYYGSISANNQGDIEVSSKGTLTYAGAANGGAGGNLLLDPKNIIITANGSVANYALIDPHAAAGNTFGENFAVLGTTVGGWFDNTTGKIVGGTFTANGNVVVTSPYDNFAASKAGAVYLFNSTTGALLSALTGSQANDQVGYGYGVTALSNGNYVVESQYWNGSRGAATWADGAPTGTPQSGIVSATNSLVGTNPNDWVGVHVTALSNGNYVVGSPNWNGRAGAATWGDGSTTGTRLVGNISSANSLVGTAANDVVGAAIIALNNGNYVVGSPGWNGSRGAATWGDGSTTGTRLVGNISSANSLVGTVANDQIGNRITALSNGNYVVGVPNWNGGTGAATWGDGSTTGTRLVGNISSGNSLVGSTVGDFVGNMITALTNGNYVVGSPNWNASRGAATWGDGSTTGSRLIGTISSVNSLVGSNAGDTVGTNVTALTNGNYVVGSPNWNTRRGAATWGNGATADPRLVGIISAANSLVGTNLNDFVGSHITALSNGNYVVGSPDWNSYRGAATWGNGSTGITGAVSSTNSLVGSNTKDMVGWSITALTNGNYVVGSPYWNGNRGAATWGDGATTGTRLIGTISSTNSLVGANALDYVGGSSEPSEGIFIQALSDGNYVVGSPSWNNGTTAGAGAATWGNGATNGTRLVGVVSPINSLVGTTTNDYVGWWITDLTNGNYAVADPVWDNNGLVDAGQVRIVTPKNINFNNGVGQTMTFNPSLLSQTLAEGTNVTLQASNDITLEAGADINVPGSTGGAFTMQAGRNITLNSKINTANGNFTAIAGDPNAIATDRDPGMPTLTLGNGATINAGTGKVVLAAINGIFNNNSGSTKPITASQWLVYSKDPSLNSRNGMVADYKHYAQPYSDTLPSYATNGNWFLYSITPTLTVTPNPQTATTGKTLNDFTYTLTGFIDGDTKDTAGISGTAIFGIENFSGKAGQYNVSYLRGLASRLGYLFEDNSQSTNELTIKTKSKDGDDDKYRNVVINIFHLNNFWLSQITPIQISVTFNGWYPHINHHHHDDDDVDTDYGQYKGGDYSFTTNYHWHRDHGKRHWHEKKKAIKLERLYNELLFIIEDRGINLPQSLLDILNKLLNPTNTP